ncbi:hypothetical protein QOZ80_1AG0020650 [Eleusine coracana subsp. coracana]|nr:hypothetical protein QOZ80_1AG0020650 [Eleusine coracana subsp. coracana]
MLAAAPVPSEASMGTEENPAALPLVRVRSRATRVDDGASTPSLGTPVTVPFHWEDAPGRPKPHRSSILATARGTDAAGTDGKGDANPRLKPLKLPPRLQVPSSTAADHHSLSPKTVLQGPYGCTGGSARRRVASFQRTPSAGSRLFFSRRKTANKKGGHDHDASYASPSPTSASSSSSTSSSAFFFGDESGPRRLPGDGRADPMEEDEGATGSVIRITRFTRNRSLPSMTSSHLWASIRKSVKQIAPWN